MLSEELTAVLLERLRNHEIDAALLATPVDDPSFAATPLFDEPFWIAYPQRHPYPGVGEDHTTRSRPRGSAVVGGRTFCLASQAMDLCRLQERDGRGNLADLRAASLETLLQ